MFKDMVSTKEGKTIVGFIGFITLSILLGVGWIMFDISRNGGFDVVVAKYNKRMELLNHQCDAIDDAYPLGESINKSNTVYNCNGKIFTK